MKHILLFVTLIFTVLTAVCQSAKNDFKRVLETKNITTLYDYLRHDKRFEQSGRVRGIVKDYSEMHTSVHYTLPKPNKEGCNIENYTIKALTAGNDIFYCVAVKTTYRENADSSNWITYNDTIVNYRDAKEYGHFREQYKEAYHCGIDTNDLYQDVVYGGDCGIAGQPPKEMEELNYFVGTYNVKAIHQWLVSPNAEKQLYAILGYRKLTHAGYGLTGEEKELINTVKKKTGDVKTCSGCMYGEENFKDVVKSIEDIPGRYLSVKKYIAFVEANEQLQVPFGTNEWMVIKLTVGFLILLALVFTIKTTRRFYNRQSAN